MAWRAEAFRRTVQFGIHNTKEKIFLAAYSNGVLGLDLSPCRLVVGVKERRSAIASFFAFSLSAVFWMIPSFLAYQDQAIGHRYEIYELMNTERKREGEK